MAKITYDSIEFDSQEELEFWHWLNEAYEAGLIAGYEYHKRSWALSEKQTYTDIVELKTKIKEVEKHLMHPHVYTPDFEIFGAKDIGLIDVHQDGWHVVDVKGTFNMYGGDREFSINQKWMYDKHGVYVHKVVPEKLFKKTWCPELVRYTPKTGKLRKKYIKCKTIKEFLNG